MLQTRWIILLCFLLIFGGCLGNSHMPQPQSGDFNGKVLDNSTGEGIAGAVLTVGENVQTVTDKKGAFVVADLPPGEYRIKLQNSWYYDQEYEGQQYVGLDTQHSYKMLPRELSGKLFYHSKSSDSYDLFCLDLTTRLTEKLFESNGTEKNPVYWKEQKILFDADYNRSDTLADLYVFDPNSSSTPTKFAADYSNSRNPASGGNLVAFETKDSSGWKIVVYNDADNVFTEVALGTNAALNRSGTKLAYVKSNKLYIYDFLSDSTNSPQYSGKVNYPSWRNDDVLALEVWEGSGQPHRIALLDVNNLAAVTMLTAAESLTENHYHPVWSNDGELLFFSGNIAYSSRIDIYAMRFSDITAATLNDTSKVILTSGSGDKRYFSFSGY